MKPYEVNRKSWHYKLAKLVDPTIEYDDGSNLCSYTRQVLLGLFVASLVAILGALATGGLLYALGDTIGYIAAGLILGEFAPFEGPPVMVAALASFGLLTVITAKTYKLYTSIREKRRQKNTPESFVTKAYSSWKDKTCFKITFD